MFEKFGLPIINKSMWRKSVATSKWATKPAPKGKSSPGIELLIVEKLNGRFLNNSRRKKEGEREHSGRSEMEGHPF